MITNLGLQELSGLSISEIASTISRDWKNVNYAAKPYLDAMFSLNDIKDNYILDTGYSVVAYFLCNANSWKGPVAREVKTELKKRLKNS